MTIPVKEQVLVINQHLNVLQFQMQYIYDLAKEAGLKNLATDAKVCIKQSIGEIKSLVGFLETYCVDTAYMCNLYKEALEELEKKEEEG